MHSELLKSVGRCFYATGIIGIGLIHFLLPGVRPIMAPLAPDEVWGWLGYAVAVVLTTSGLSLLVNKKSQVASIMLIIVFVLFLLIGHLPNRLQYHPEMLSYWTDAIKLLALTGGAMVMYHAGGREKAFSMHKGFDRVADFGKYLYAFMLMMFGIAHLVNAEFVKTIVPAWIPGNLFWTYLTGVALMGAGLSIFINVKVRQIMSLLAIMLFIWLIVVHLPSTIEYPLRDPVNPFMDGNRVISLLQCLAFCGIALVIRGRAAQGLDRN
ncbi:hypothetical protein WBG78_14485 [Chryseolinea sp. T2]|uniref:hypothetical protein n=1 Tax=Chryseolinea sp. T2 TaxID=3129255 RepID=UPI003076C3C3